MGRRLGILAVFCLIAGSIVFAATPSNAGGFCGEGRFTDETTTQIDMSKMCFMPTVARVEVGDTVTFTNKDGLFHAVGGVTNVFGDMHTEVKPDASVSYRFEDEGVYPYVCILHPGMAGAIVVGDGKGKASAATVSRVTPTDQDPQPAMATEERSATTSDTGWVLPVALVALAALALAGLRMKRRSATGLT